MPPSRIKHSSKRDRIVEVFLRQEGHVSADDLVAVVRREAPGIGRATVYRTLQWMVASAVARKVDFGDGRANERPLPNRRHTDLRHLLPPCLKIRLQNRSYVYQLIDQSKNGSPDD